MSHEEVKKHVRTYLVVFVALLCLSAVTVGISYLHVSRGMAIALAMIVATVKASLVALFFMHLIDEKKTIYYILELTAVLFVFLCLIVLFINSNVA